jgi:hypothetical protein
VVKIWIRTYFLFLATLRHSDSHVVGLGREALIRKILQVILRKITGQTPIQENWNNPSFTGKALNKFLTGKIIFKVENTTYPVF